jgi:uncharacterized protein YcfJ
MKRRIALFTGLALTASTAFANQYEDYAYVRSVTPEYEQVNVPREECYSEYVPGTYNDGARRLSGAIIGGIAGGVLGAQVGKGSGNTAATAAGAITGAIVGDRIQNKGYHDEYAGREVRRCHQVDNWESRLTGYRVVYEYAGHTYSTVMPNDPGKKLKVRVAVAPVTESYSYKQPSKYYSKHTHNEYDY